MAAVDGARYPVNTPIGAVVVCFRPAPFAITQIRLPVWKSDAGPVHPGTVRPLFPAGNSGLQHILDLLDRYFNRMAVSPPWEMLDMGGMTPLQQRVLRAVAAIPFGGVKTYGDIARAVGSPKACRFVGNTMAGNPFPVLIPCHRVVRRGGGAGGFGGGPDLKKRLIAFEKGADVILSEDPVRKNPGCQP